MLKSIKISQKNKVYWTIKRLDKLEMLINKMHISKIPCHFGDFITVNALRTICSIYSIKANKKFHIKKKPSKIPDIKKIQIKIDILAGELNGCEIAEKNNVSKTFIYNFKKKLITNK